MENDSIYKIASKSLNYYVGSSFFNKEQVRETFKRLNNLGWNLQLDWTDEEPSIKPHIRKGKAIEDIQAAMNCDFAIFLLPARFGAHGEIGAAIASATLNPDKKIFVWAEKYEDLYYQDSEESNWYKSIFFYHPKVKVLKCSYDRLIEILEEEGHYWRNNIKECCR